MHINLLSIAINEITKNLETSMRTWSKLTDDIITDIGE